WPLLATLGVLTLGASTVSLVTRATALHAASVIAAALVVAAWALALGAPWGLTAILVSMAVSAFALIWLRVVRDAATTGAGAAALFIGEATALLATMNGAPPFAAVVATHVVNLSVLLALTSAEEWQRVALWAVAPAGLALELQAQTGQLPAHWLQLL